MHNHSHVRMLKPTESPDNRPGTNRIEAAKPPVNWQKRLDLLIRGFRSRGVVPRLALHACCAPCSSYVLEYLSQYFDITLFYYNPNITDRSEYLRRVNEVRRLVAVLPAVRPVSFAEGPYEPQAYLQAVKGLENEPEGGARCARCFMLRLEKTAAFAATMAASPGAEVLFTTTLTISPLKNAGLLNETGIRAASAYPGIAWLDSDFKKRDGYKRSIQLSAQYGLYRQDYCGCAFSKAARHPETDTSSLRE